MKRRAGILLILVVLLLAATVCAEAIIWNDEWTCRNCGRENNKGRFCGSCGSSMEDSLWTCDACGNINNLDFCTECGLSRETSLAESSRKATRKLAEERRLFLEELATHDLWDADVTVSIECFPEEAFRDEEDICIGTSEDGARMLILPLEGAPYAYDLLEGESHMITAFDPDTIQYVRNRVYNVESRAENTESLQVFRIVNAETVREWLLPESNVLTTEQKQEIQDNLNPDGTIQVPDFLETLAKANQSSGDYGIARSYRLEKTYSDPRVFEDYTWGPWYFDLDTYTARIRYEKELINGTAGGGFTLIDDNNEFIVRNSRTGEERPVSFAQQELLSSGRGSICSGFILDDGRVAAIISEKNEDQKRMVNLTLMIAEEDSTKAEGYSFKNFILGSYSMRDIPREFIFAKAANELIVYNSDSAINSCAIFLDTGNVTQLSFDGHHDIRFITAMQDGKNYLLLDPIEKEVYMYHAGTHEMKPLLNGQVSVSNAAIWSNGLDEIYSTISLTGEGVVRQYIKLSYEF